MGRLDRFTPANEVDRIPLTDGDWIEVKRDLNNGELKKLEAAGLDLPVRLSDGSVNRPIDWERYEIERAAIWLTDWSFRDFDDKPVPLKNKEGQVSFDVLKALDIASFDEINAAILRHVMGRAQAKKAAREAKEGTPPTPPDTQVVDVSELTSGPTSGS